MDVIPQVLELATPLAQALGLEVVDAIFHTNRRPPVLRVDVRHPSRDTGLNDCEQMSRALEAALDARDLIGGAYVLEVSSPGISRQLASDREFVAFRGFNVTISTDPPFENRKQWRGQLQGRDERAVYINQKGRAIALPRQVVAKVQLEG